MDAAARLDQLMPLANGDELSERALRQRLLAFLHGIDLPGLRLRRDAGMWDTHDAPAAELRATQRQLQDLFASAFWFSEHEAHLPYWVPPGTPKGSKAEFEDPISWDDLRPPLSFPSLRFGAEYIARPSARWALRVDAGRLRDLVPFLALWMLTCGDLSVARCEAPAAAAWDRPCGRFFISGGRGRPSRTCSDKCRRRVKDKRKNERIRELLRENTALRRAAQRNKQQKGRRAK